MVLEKTIMGLCLAVPIRKPCTTMCPSRELGVCHLQSKGYLPHNEYYVSIDFRLNELATQTVLSLDRGTGE
jgi:hypothetical protein